MATITINTHEAFKTLVNSGLSKKQAEGHIEVLENIDISGVATKDDLSRLEYRLKIWVLGGFLTQLITLTGLIFVMFQFFQK